MRQVAWPTRPEVVNSPPSCFVTLVLLVSLIFLLNYAFSHAVPSCSVMTEFDLERPSESHRARRGTPERSPSTAPRRPSR